LRAEETITSVTETGYDVTFRVQALVDGDGDYVQFRE
jgi:hypothetical protein